MRRSRAFTLLEVMLVVGIITILALIAFGFSGTFTRQEGLKEVTRNTVAALSQARAEAVRSSTRVSVNFGTPSAPRIIVFVDTNGSYLWEVPERKVFSFPPEISSGPSVIQAGYTAVLPNGITVTSSPSASLKTTNPFTAETAVFDYQGYSIDPQGNPSVGATLCVRDPRTPIIPPFAVTLTVAGAARVVGGAQASLLCP